MAKYLLPMVAALSLLIAANFAQSQAQDDKSRQSGKYHLAAGKTYNMHAHDHARMLGKYAALGKTVPSDVVKEHASAIRYDAQAAKRSFASLGKTAPNNPQLAKQLEQLQARLDRVTELTKKLEAQTSKNAAESKVVAAQSQEISELLRTNHTTAKAADSDFYDSDSDNYYSTGEGHFVD